MDKTFRAVTSLPWRVEKIQSDLGTPFEKGVPPLRHSWPKLFYYGLCPNTPSLGAGKRK
jgi:hypothetical protein